jgi:hypothetical protein
VRPEQHGVLDEQAQVFERGHLRAEAEGRALLEVAPRDVRDRAEVSDPAAGRGEGLVKHRELFHDRLPARAAANAPKPFVLTQDFAVIANIS